MPKDILKFCACPICGNFREILYVPVIANFGLVCNGCGDYTAIDSSYIGGEFKRDVIVAIQHMRTSHYSDEAILEYIDECFEAAKLFTSTGCSISEHLHLPEDEYQFKVGLRLFCKVIGRLRVQMQLLEMGFNLMPANFIMDDEYICLN
jgi:hypothetical protein